MNKFVNGSGVRLRRQQTFTPHDRSHFLNQDLNPKPRWHHKPTCPPALSRKRWGRSGFKEHYSGNEVVPVGSPREEGRETDEEQGRGVEYFKGKGGREMDRDELIEFLVAENDRLSGIIRSSNTPYAYGDLDPLDAEECIIGESCDVEDESLREFLVAFLNRAKWLIGLLVFQSASSFVLASNNDLIADHPAIVYYLTMLVGAGGNAGNQSAVRMVRGLATSQVNRSTWGGLLWRETGMAALLAITLAVVGYLRVLLFTELGGTTVQSLASTEAITIAVALMAIVGVAVLTGAVLPIAMQRLRLDAAHSTTTVQVIMDIFGVAIAVFVCKLMMP